MAHLNKLKVHSKVLQKNGGVIIKTLIFDRSTLNDTSNTAITNLTIFSAKRFNDYNYKPANIYLFKVNNRNTGKICERCSKLTIETLFFVCFIVGFEQVNVSW